MATEEKSLVEVRQRRQGGVIPSQMAVGSYILIETEDFIYRITRESGHWFLESGHPLVRTNNMLVGIKSTDTHSGLTMFDWVGKGMILTLDTPYGVSIITKEVESAVIGGDNYEVDVWE